jgi:Rps23 Pro-64 3,4-dihydroxylase Tpa1-like proline 4-hydroxylase
MLAKQYLSPAVRQKLRKQYASAGPTHHILLRDFLELGKFVKLKTALRKQKFSQKEADLFSFSQTENLFVTKDKTIIEFLQFLKSKELADFLQEITGVKIKTGSVDASGFIYGPGDHLLCHDDGFSSRRIAYVLNCNTMISGGSLCFFSSNRKGEPVTVTKRLTPEENSLSLFTVTRTSHHMVEEVLKGERLSIAGWFHG